MNEVERAWVDRPLPEDDAIKAAHPLRSGRHDLYAEAMRLIGARHSKAGLVELVNWLLVDREEAREMVRNPMMHPNHHRALARWDAEK